MKLYLFVLLSLIASNAWAQGQSAHPTGQFTPGHGLRANTGSGSPYSDAGGAAGSDKRGSGYLTEMGITGPGLPFCINDKLINDPAGYHRFCLGHDANGNAQIVVDDLGGAPTTGCNLIINGVSVPCGGPASTSLQTAITNTVLKALNGASSSAVQRLGFTTAGDRGNGLYVWSTSDCTLDNGNGDNGSQVAPDTGPGCWLLTEQQSYDVTQWGVTLANPIHLTVDITGADTNLCGIVVAVPCRTITGAQKTANKLNVGGNSVTIDLPANTVFNECVAQTGPLLGGATNRPNPFNPNYTLGPSMLIIKGKGATTIFDGCDSFFYTIEASQGGIVAIQDLTMRSTGANQQLSAGAQLGGQLISLGGITWGANGGTSVWCEDVGSICMLMGTDSITNGGQSFGNVSGLAHIEILGYALAWTAPISAGLTFNQGFFRVSAGGQIFDNGPGGHGFVNSINGRSLILSDNSIFANQTGIAISSLLPTGTAPILKTKGSRIIPEPASFVNSASTGCGTTCTTTLTSRGPGSGFAIITPGGTGIGSSGGFNIYLGTPLYDGSIFSPCIATFNGGGTGTWGGATVETTTPTIALSTEAFTVNWANGSPLTTGQTYIINYQCSDGS